MRLLLDEMYPAALADTLGQAGIDAVTVAALRLSGAADPEIFAAAQAAGRVVLTENVADFTRLAAEQAMSGAHHSGLLIALSSRFSGRPAGLKPLAEAIQAVAGEDFHDRVAYLEAPDGKR